MTTLPTDRFQEIVKLHAAPLTLYARQFFEQHDFHAAEEVVQDVLFRLSQQPNEPEHLAAWLYKSVRNAAITAARSVQRRKRRESTWIPFFQQTRDEDAEHIASLLEKLEPVQREIVMLYIWGDRPFKEIAGILNMPMTSVYTMLYHEPLIFSDKQS